MKDVEHVLSRRGFFTKAGLGTVAAYGLTSGVAKQDLDIEANALIRRTYREGHWAMPEG